MLVANSIDVKLSYSKESFFTTVIIVLIYWKEEETEKENFIKNNLNRYFL